MTKSNNSSTTSAKHPWPDERGRYGAFGGKYVPETLMRALGELETAYAQAKADPAFDAQLDGTETSRWMLPLASSCESKAKLTRP